MLGGVAKWLGRQNIEKCVTFMALTLMEIQLTATTGLELGPKCCRMRARRVGPHSLTRVSMCALFYLIAAETLRRGWSPIQFSFYLFSLFHHHFLLFALLPPSHLPSFLVLNVLNGSIKGKKCEKRIRLPH